MCLYKNKYYDTMEDIFDEDTCRTCVCYAPDKIFCCQAELVPEQMPRGCIVDPAGRHSHVHRLGKCMAPLIDKRTIGRQPRMCSDRQLSESLAGSSLRLPSNSFHGSHKIRAHRNYRNNYKRQSGMQETVIFQLLRNFLDNGIHELEVHRES